jgi:uncharacterized protein YraI
MKKFVSIVWLAIVCAGCSFSVDVIEADAPTEFVVTSTLPPSPTSKPSETPLPPPPTGTVVPAAGTTSTQVNVRVEPSTSSEVVGIIPENTNVEIIGKDPGGNWWLIKYPQGGQAPEGEGWVTAEFVVTAGEPAVPVVGGAGVNPNGDNMAIIQQQLNVRSGPGTNFNAIGALNAQDVVTLTGKDAGGVWLQIAFAAGPDGKGWVNAAFAQADVSSLPIVSDAGQVIGTGAPENTAVPAEPTVAPAALDNDSAVAPAVNITLTAGGMRSFQYSSDVSSPTGDAEDWIQFKTFSVNTKLELECAGSYSYIAELLLNYSVADTLVCGKIILFLSDPNGVYAVHFVSSPTGGMEYTKYILRVEAIP